MRIPAGWMGLTLLVLLLLSPPALAADKELAHDDGERADRQSAAGTGHVICYEAPKGDWWIKSVRVHGARYGGGYDPATTMCRVALCDEDLVPLLVFDAPYAKFAAGRFGWVDLAFPRVTVVPRTFKIAVSFDPSATRGVFVGWAKTEESHSSYGLPGGSERPYKPEAEWMIRPVLAKKPPRDAVKEVVLALDDGVVADMRSLGGSGHVIELKKPSGTWWIQSVLLHGKRYGGGYDPQSTTFSVAVANVKMQALARQRAPYALFSNTFSWQEVELDEPVKAPAKFRIAVDFDPGRTQGVYLGYAAAAKPHSYTGLVGGSTQRFGDGEWMIRVRLVSEQPAPAERAEPEASGSDEKIYRKDFEFLARTVRDKFDALEKKGVDWKAVCAEWKPRFEACADDATHVQNARRLLAVLGDSHTGVTSSKVEVHSPVFDGLYGAGMWIATEGGDLLLRALLPGHALEKRLVRGARLVAIDGKPARIVHEGTRAKLRTWGGWSSTHFLDARLSFQFFPFGAKRTLPATFVNPGGEVVDVDLPRWGPGGRGLSRIAVTMPAGVEAQGHAVSTKLGDDLGYLRILGGMHEETRKAFFDAFDSLQGVKGILLDCRGMNGGGDSAAWAMAGRFFSKRTPLKHDPALKPTGDWQFDGPVVMLQDEREMSSAETFTWAMAETGRAVSVGRPTGGATIIPRRFEVPSGLFAFRLGCRDRETSVEGVHPEGIGSPPHVDVPYEPAMFARSDDPVRAVGLDVLRWLVAGTPRAVVVDVYDGVLDPDPEAGEALRKALAAWRALDRPADLVFADLTGELLEERILGVSHWLTSTVNPTPAVAEGERRLAGLAAVARILPHERAVRLAGGHRPEPAEAAAQAAWEALVARGFPPNAQARAAYVKEYRGTRWAQAVESAFD